MTGLPEIIDPYLYKRLLICSIIVMAAIVVILFIALISHKIYVESRERKIKRLKELFIAATNRKLMEPGAEIRKERDRMHFEVLGDVIIDMLASITGEMEEKAKDFARELGIGEHFRKRAMSRLWSRRVMAIEKLGFLRLPEMRDFYHGLLKAESDKEILARTVLALSFIAEDVADIRAINQVLKNPLFKSSKFCEYVYTNILKSLRKGGREEIFTDFLVSLKDDASIPLVLKKDIVEACGSDMFYPAKGVIMKYFYHFSDDAGMKIACVRALGRLGGEDICGVMKDCLKEKDWRVRAVASKNAHICGEEAIDSLRKALGDKNYYVRINSAMALSMLGEKGISALREELKSDDRFSRDVSNSILNEVKIRV